MESGMIGAVRGMMAGIADATRQAERVRQFGQGENDLTDPLIRLNVDTTQVKASAAAIRSQQQMDRSLLDLFA